MTSRLTHYFQETAEEPELHPKARYWRSVLESGRAKSAVCELRRERRGIVGYGPAKLYVTFFDANGEMIASPDEVDWEPELDAELVRLKVRARTPANEAERTGLMFGRRFGQLGVEYGDGYVNAVLIERLHDQGFAEVPSVADKLRRIHENKPSHDGRAYRACAEAIDGVIKSRAHALARDLGYPPDEAAAILGDAMAYFLDEEYSITSRSALGFG